MRTTHRRLLACVTVVALSTALLGAGFESPPTPKASREIRITGRMTPTAKQELAALGWTVLEQASPG